MTEEQLRVLGAIMDEEDAWDHPRNSSQWEMVMRRVVRSLGFDFFAANGHQLRRLPAPRGKGVEIPYLDQAKAKELLIEVMRLRHTIPRHLPLAVSDVQEGEVLAFYTKWVRVKIGNSWVTEIYLETGEVPYALRRFRSSDLDPRMGDFLRDCSRLKLQVALKDCITILGEYRREDDEDVELEVDCKRGILVAFKRGVKPRFGGLDYIPNIHLGILDVEVLVQARRVPRLRGPRTRTLPVELIRMVQKCLVTWETLGNGV